MSPTSTDLFILPLAQDDEHHLQQRALCMKKIRLEALKTDPQWFSSFYAKESGRPDEFWINRLRNPEARHLIIVSRNLKGSPEGDTTNLVDQSWLGSMVLLGPRVAEADRFDDKRGWEMSAPFPGKLENIGDIAPQKALVYQIAGLWVAPTCRRQGFGKRLFEGAIAEIKRDRKQEGSTRSICMIEVGEENFPAQELYRSFGFQIVEADTCTTEDGRQLREFIMRLDISFGTQ